MSRPANEAMPYVTPDALPAAIRADLPVQVRQLYLDSFNSAWRRYADFADREAFCHRLARSAVRRHQRVLAAPPHRAGPSATMVQARS
jgi:cation transport regulator ChaB